MAPPNGQATAGTTFSLGVLDIYYNPLPPVRSPVDPHVAVDIAPISGSVSATNLADSVVTVGAISSVSEPASVFLIASGLGLIAGIRYRRTTRVLRPVLAR